MKYLKYLSLAFLLLQASNLQSAEPLAKLPVEPFAVPLAEALAAAINSANKVGVDELDDNASDNVFRKTNLLKKSGPHRSGKRRRYSTKEEKEENIA